MAILELDLIHCLLNINPLQLIVDLWALIGAGVYASAEGAHFSVPLVSEPGMELIPGTHKQWDTEEQLNVRLEQNGHKNYEDLKQGVVVNLNAGDLLVFSANMIHRGLYGNDRMALDILFCDPDPQLMAFVDKACLPSREIMKKLDNSAVFEAALSMT